MTNKMRSSSSEHLGSSLPSDSDMYEFFENVRIISTDFILEIKDVPNKSDTEIHLLKSSSVFYPVIF